MSPGLNTLITLGQDITSFKYYAIATGTVLFYDYLLTLPDEIKYVWSKPRRRSWVFWLFVFNRYFPMTYQFWHFTVSYGSRSHTKLCSKTAFYHIFVAAICILLAQITVTARIYAVSLRRIPFAIGFGSITVIQLAIGMWMTVLAVKRGAQPELPIPFDAYHLCLFVRDRTLDVVFTSASMVYDTLALFTIIFFAKRVAPVGFGTPTILDAIKQDAAWYFLVIFATHLVLLMTLSFGREEIQLLPATGTPVYLPVMASRIMLSLKKAADVERGCRSLGLPTVTVVDFQTMEFCYPSRGDGVSEDNVSLDSHVRWQVDIW